MIKENQLLFNRLNVLSDGGLILTSMLLAKTIYFHFFSGNESIASACYVWLGVAAAILCPITYLLHGLYASHRFVNFYKESTGLLWANLLNSLVLVSSLYIFHLSDVSRWIMLIFFFCSSTLLLLKRCSTRILLRFIRKKGLNQKHVVLVGCGSTAQTYLNKISANPEFGFRVDGYVSNKANFPSLRWLGPYHKLEAILETCMPDEVVMAIPAGEEHLLPHLSAACEKAGARLSLIPCFADFISSTPHIDTLDGLPMINLRYIPLDNIGNAILKRLFDFSCAVLLILLTSPMMLAAAVGVKRSSPGPIIFKQERVGRGKKRFYMYKFRSMYVNDSADITWSTETDCRKTRFGTWMRKYSIDELPQLFNVIKGEMSLVGPRPELPFFVEQFRENIPRYMVKHQIRPGMTGWAQVNGLRGNTSIRRRIEYDLFYIENWNLLMDLKIMCMTLFHLSPP